MTPLTRIVLLFFLALALIPAPLLIAPAPAHAIFGAGDTVFDPINFVKNTLTAAASSLISSATNSLTLKEYYLDPIAWALSQKILQSVTGSVVNFVNGQGAGGSPLYVQNLGQYLGAVADNKALNFFAEIGQQSNSPFAAAIASSLRTNYLQSSSAAGFWAQNTCTLSQYSNNPSAFVSGANFNTNGGWSAWFALLQPQNNPYSQYYTAQAELSARVANAQVQQNIQLGYNQGFFSWCQSDSGASTITSSSNATKGAPQVGNPCIKSDGTSGVVATPGSVLSATLDKTLGSSVDKLVAADEISELIGQIAAGLLTSAIGGSSGGLAGLSSGGSNSYISQYQNENPGAAASSATNVSGLITTAQNNASQYQAAWNTIAAAAQTASSSVETLIACENQHNSGTDPYGALTAQNTLVAPTLAQAATAATQVQNLNKMIAQVQADQNSTTAGAGGALAADSQTLAAMPPSATDVLNAQTNAQTGNSATSSSPTSLAVTGGSLVDQMNLLTTNAGNALAACQNPSQRQ